MTDNQLEFIKLIRESDGSKETVETIVNIILSVLEQPSASPTPSVVGHQESY